MNISEFTTFLTKIFNNNHLGDCITQEKAEKLYKLANLLISTNKEYNLTAITDEESVILKHFADSATISKYIPQNSTVIDVGCGAGFPSLPLAIIRSDLQITSIDSTGKKINFVKKAANELALNNIEGICTRAEDFAKDKRESFDICTSRAVASLEVLDELCLPFVKKGGTFIAMKSSKGAEEFSKASNGIAKLGGKLENVEKITLSSEDTSIERELYIIRKITNTPLQYPRNYSQITKKPL